MIASARRGGKVRCAESTVGSFQSKVQGKSGGRKAESGGGSVLCRWAFSGLGGAAGLGFWGGGGLVVVEGVVPGAVEGFQGGGDGGGAVAGSGSG